MYNFKEIEKKWQKIWDEDKIFEVDLNKAKNTFYCLVMFPYPSGSLHMGHVRNYVIGDVIANYKRMQGFDVIHPIGWDAFGLPAENAAIQHNIHPEKWTKQNIETMKQQLKDLGISYDWSKEISTCEPQYYKFNQWFFIKMYEKDLVYRKKAPVNYCPSCKTVLANEQAEGGVCWRCNSLVEEREMEQWFFKITKYADELLEDHKIIEDGWPEEVLTMQKNWIGKSEGAEVDFLLDDNTTKIRIYTTRPDTLFGATFLVLSPDHELTSKIPTKEREKDVMNYIRKVKTIPADTTREKEGVFTGRYAINPLNKEKIPIWVSNYVVAEYGTGAIMSVPAHDQRDFEFAKKYNLPIKVVIKGPTDNPEELNEAYEGVGIMINSGQFNGLNSKTGTKRIIEYIERNNLGRKAIKYKLKDWLISRQRYWGTPIPVIYCDNCGIQTVPLDKLPIVLPKDVEITGLGESPLARLKEFVETNCHICKRKARRETDTMDTFVDSSWYYARYLDPRNNDEPFSRELAARNLPVNIYIGGIEHACLHLIYARFFHKVMRDLGLVNSDEPFSNLLTQGMVTLGGVAMSKSRGNVVEPQTITEKYGADTLRLFILFAAPPRKQLEWSDSGIEGCKRFLNRVWELTEKILQSKGIQQKVDEAEKKSLLVALNKTIKKVTNDVEKEYQFNTAIASIMEFMNLLTKYGFLGDDASFESIKTVIKLLSVFTPHLAEELWEKIGEKKSVRLSPWPVYDESLIESEKIEFIVQVNGKTRDVLKVERGLSQEEIIEIITKLPKLQKYIKDVEKIIFIKDKLMNFVAKNHA